jgi:hypothetical protein
MKVIVGLAVVAVLAGLATSWARDKGTSLVHHAFDASLPGTVAGHVWVPVEHGHTVRAGRMRFMHGRVTTVRCHATLGTFEVRVDHGFSFAPAAGAVREGCPGRSLSSSLAKATRADVEEHGQTVELKLSDENGETVATFRSRGD